MRKEKLHWVSRNDIYFYLTSYLVEPQTFRVFLVPVVAASDLATRAPLDGDGLAVVGRLRLAPAVRPVERTRLGPVDGATAGERRVPAVLAAADIAFWLPRE